MLRRLLIAMLLLLLAAVVVVDRVGAHVAAHVLAGKLQSDEHLPNRPSVSIGGIPFLTQAFGGTYHDVRVTAHDFKTPDGVTVTTLKANLHGAHIPLSKILDGSVKTVPIDHVDGKAFMSFGAISHYVGAQGLSITLSRSSSHSVKVTGRMPVGGRLRLVDTVVTVAVSQSVVTLSGPAGAGSTRLLSLPIPLRSLPFRFNVTSVTVGANGITGTGRANHVELGS